MSRTYFGLAAIAFYRQDGALIGVSDLPASAALEIAHPIIPSVGGARGFPAGARLGRTEAQMTLTMNERPHWIAERLAIGMDVVPQPEPASNPNAFVFPADRITPQGIAGLPMIEETSPGSTSTLPFTLGIPASARILEMRLTPRGIDAVDITFFLYDENGTEVGAIHPGPFIMNVGSNLTDTFTLFGVRLRATPNATTEQIRTLLQANGNRITYRSAPRGTTGRMLPEQRNIPAVPIKQEYKVRLYTTPGGESDTPIIWDVPRCVISPASLAATDNEPSNGVELQCTILPDAMGNVIKRADLR